MKTFFISKKKLLVSILIFFVVLVTTSSSEYFIAKEMNHKCQGKECEICQIVCMSEFFVRTLNVGSKAVFVFLLLLYLKNLSLRCVQQFKEKRTLVSLKIMQLD